MSVVLTSSAIILLYIAPLLADSGGYFLPVDVVDEDIEGSVCTTPNNRTGTCIEIKSCTDVINAISTKTEDAINFVKNSQCGFTIYQPLVCCSYDDLSITPTLRHKLLPTFRECGMEAPSQSRLVEKSISSWADFLSDDISNEFHGGTKSTLTQHPWMAMLKYLNDGVEKFLCGGTLISSRYVLTAAHCTKIPPYLDRQLIGVRLGEHTISTNVDCEEITEMRCADPVVDVGVEQVIFHPNYHRNRQIHDISLIRLAKNVQFTDYIRPVCLPVENNILPVSTSVFVVGWGETEKSASSDVKIFGYLPVIAPTNCRIKFGSVVQDYQFCAGGMDNSDSCMGDSGGPALRMGTVNNYKQWVQEGIVSYGLNDCGVEGWPGVYTRVSKYVNWIIDNIAQ